MADLANLAGLADLVDQVDLASLADQTYLADFVEISLCSYWVYVSFWHTTNHYQIFLNLYIVIIVNFPWLQSYTHPIENRYSFSRIVQSKCLFFTCFMT